MTPKQWLGVGALASISFAAAAQQTPARPDPLDASAAVPAATYKSAFDGYQRANGGDQPSADKAWRMANDEVAKAEGHTGHAAQTNVATPPPPKAEPVAHGHHH